MKNAGFKTVDVLYQNCGAGVFFYPNKKGCYKLNFFKFSLQQSHIILTTLKSAQQKLTSPSFGHIFPKP
jgi:hypothetical protein